MTFAYEQRTVEVDGASAVHFDRTQAGKGWLLL
jgi:hypothetical protein